MTPSGVRGPNVRTAGAPARGAVRAVSVPRESSTASRTLALPTLCTPPAVHDAAATAGASSATARERSD